jgi:hypothetical protein
VTVAMLYLAELTLRILHTDPGFAAVERAEQAGTPFDSRSRMEVVRDLRDAGVDAVPRLVPATLRIETPDQQFRSMIAINGREIRPLAGISGKTTVLCNEVGEYAVYESDEHGFRNPRGMWDLHSVEVVLLGDSFTIGECVSSDQALGDLIRTTFPATLNLGFSGNSPLLELATLKEYGPALRPRRVLWFYFENDLWWFDLGMDRRTPLLMRYVRSDFRQGLLEMQSEIDDRLGDIVESGLDDGGEASPVTRMHTLRGEPFARLLKFLMLKTLRTTIGQIRHPYSSATLESPDYDLFRTILRQAQSMTESWDGELILVYLPGVWHFERGTSLTERATTEQWAQLRTIASSLGLRIIDVKAAIDQHDDPLSLYSYRGSSALGPPHMNADGYAFTAAVVLEHLPH